jgi:hypothetical protein
MFLCLCHDTLSISLAIQHQMDEWMMMMNNEMLMDVKGSGHNLAEGTVQLFA